MRSEGICLRRAIPPEAKIIGADVISTWSGVRPVVSSGALSLSGYLIYRLCGQYRDSVASQVAYIPFDYKKHAWASPSDWKWQVTRLRPEQLPELVMPGQIIGHVSAEAARATGIPEGLPIVAAGADKACEVLGSGVSDEETAVQTAIKRMSGAPRLFEPDPTAHQTYDRIYCNVYLKMYDRLKDFYSALHSDCT